jgi:phosphatidylserine decarboxylase
VNANSNKYAGRAAHAGARLRVSALFLLVALLTGGLLARAGGLFIAVSAGAIAWLLFASVTFCFFRDPTPHVPLESGVVVSPAHGRVDCVEQTTEPHFLGSPCHRISIFLSVFDVHVQNAPVTGKIALVTQQSGRFLSALRTDSAQYNENALVGITCASGERVAVRQIAGLIARRIITWVQPGDSMERGERIGLIQFGSRCDVYLPITWRIVVKPGDKVRGGETIIGRT